MNTPAIKKELLTRNPDELDRRRKVIVLSALGLVDFIIISLYQTGIIKKLPDLPGRLFDSNKVNAAPDAYILGIPDGPVSAAAYAAIIALAAAGTKKTSRKQTFDLLLAGVVCAQAAGGVYYMHNMIFKQKKICLYCVTGALINFASVVILAPIVIKSIRKFFGRR